MKKINEWIKRYLPAAIASLVLTLLSAELTFYYSQNNIATALIATLAGSITYYGYILIIDVNNTRKECSNKKENYTYVIFLKNIRAMFVEFGIAELIDSLLIRPFLMYYIPVLVGNLAFGIFLAKITADILFYIPTIIAYELSKKKFRNFH